MTVDICKFGLKWSGVESSGVRQCLAGSKGSRLANASTANPRLQCQVISTRNGMPAKFSSILASLALIYD